MNQAPTVADARHIFDRQRAASRGGPPPDAALRRDRLRRLRELVRSGGDSIAAAISADFGHRSPVETELLELVPTLNAIRYAEARLARWMKPERRPVSWLFRPARAWVRHEPLGVVGIIAPWNYPLLLALSPLVDAIAAGNRAMLKPSELTPRFSALLAALIGAAFDPDEVAVVPGGVEMGKAFAALPFDHLLFTGSTEIGREVYRAAAANLTPVTLELGGKSPALVAPGFDIGKAARSIAFGKFVNAGQTCIAPDYALVPADRALAFAEALIDRARRSYPAESAAADYSGIISERHRERILGAIDAARRMGATVLSHPVPAARGVRRIDPTVVLGVPADSLLLSEEIFGPVLPVVGYGRLEEALAFIAGRERPLALYCFSDDAAIRRRVLEGALSGGVTLNGTLLHVAQDSLPFGGVGPSGIGAYHGREGFRRFSHALAVHETGFVNMLERIGPPWNGRGARAMLPWLRRLSGLSRRA